MRRIENLSPDRLRVADDFLSYLEECENAEATSELLEISELLQEVKAARGEIAAGKVTPLTELRRKY